jgi:hypothetical protein
MGFPVRQRRRLGRSVLPLPNLTQATPLFEGDLDQEVFGGAGGVRAAQWQAEVTGTGFAALPAETMHGLSEGAVLAVMGSAADADGDALGFVELTSVETFAASGQAVDMEGKVLPADLPKGLLLRKQETVLDFTLTVALLPPGSGPADQDADLRLAVLPDSARPDAVWVLPSTGLADDLAGAPSVTTIDKDVAALARASAETLVTMARAQHLLKLAGAVGLVAP